MEAVALITTTLSHISSHDLQGFLKYYRPAKSVLNQSRDSQPLIQLTTMPVRNHDVGDGDGLNVYVDISNPKVNLLIDSKARDMMSQRDRAVAAGNCEKEAFLRHRIASLGYRYVQQSGSLMDYIFGKRFVIRFSAVDAPETPQPFGMESRSILLSLIEGKSLSISGLYYDKYNRLVSDVHTNEATPIFVQVEMLKRGAVWSYAVNWNEMRTDFNTLEKQARIARAGLWKYPNPEEPRKWRKLNGACSTWRKN